MKHSKLLEENPESRLMAELEDFERWMVSHGIDVPPSAEASLQTYLRTLLEWNRRTQLISRHDEANLVNRHVYESIVPLILIQVPANAKLLDLGSGAGFPGLVLKIVRPDLRLILLESQRRRALFLRHVIQKLPLSDAEVVCARAEQVADRPEYVGRYQMVTARAVADLSRLWEWSQPLLAPGGQLVAYKGGNVTTEVERLRQSQPVRVIIKPFPEIEPIAERNRKLIIVQEEHRREP